MRTATHTSWLAAAAGYAVVLVFIGHFAENLFYFKISAGFPILKWIYSFHWPLFFALAGYAGVSTGLRGREWFHDRLAKRIVPAVFFAFLSMPFFLLVGGPGEFGLKFYLTNLANFAKGHFIFCETAWFLVCLFTVELLDRVWSRHTGGKVEPVVAGVLILIVGTLVCQQMTRVVRFTGLAQNFWMLHEAILAFGFYQLGIALRQSQRLKRDLPVWAYALICIAGFLIVSLTFNLNQGPFTADPPVVMMSLSSHGNPVWFPLTALAGIVGVLALSQLTAGFRPLLFLGKNWLPFLALSAFFYNFVDGPVIITPLGQTMRSTAVALLFCVISACVWMLVSVPLIHPLNRALAAVEEKFLSLARVPREGSRSEIPGRDGLLPGGPARPGLPSR